MLPSADSEDKRWRYQVARAWCWANARSELFKGATNWIQTISWNTTEGQEKSLRERQITCYSFELGEEIRATRNTVSVSSWQQQQGLEINWGLVGVWATSVGSSQLAPDSLVVSNPLCGSFNTAKPGRVHTCSKDKFQAQENLSLHPDKRKL